MQYKYTRTFTHDGKRYYIRGNTLEEVAAKMALRRRDLDEQTASSNMTVKEWAHKATALYKTNVSDRTRDEFVSLTDRVLIRRMGEMKLAQVKPFHLQEIINEYKGASVSQVGAVYHVLRFVFGKAYQNDLIARDPSERIIKPTARKKKTRRALTADERAAVIAVGMSDKKYLVFMLMILCGCRPDEAASVRVSDVTQAGRHNILHVRGTKTALSDRIVPFPSILSSALKNTRKSDYIAPYDDGTKLDKFRRRRLWSKFCDDVNIYMGAAVHNDKPVPPLPFDDVVPYCLRHEYCTELARRGVDIRVAQKLMGHASIRMTANVYTNLTDADVLAACDLVESATLVQHSNDTL